MYVDLASSPLYNYNYNYMREREREIFFFFWIQEQAEKLRVVTSEMMWWRQCYHVINVVGSYSILPLSLSLLSIYLYRRYNVVVKGHEYDNVRMSTTLSTTLKKNLI